MEHTVTTRDCDEQGANESQNAVRKKVAPRSTLQFKVGPPFSETLHQAPVYCSGGLQVTPVISCRLDRGFDFEEGIWVGYKRNYFTLVAAFRFEEIDLQQLLWERFTTIDLEKTLVNITMFALGVSAFCVETNEEARVIQHTAKRDKGPQTSPDIIPSLPGELPDHEFIRDCANIRNRKKLKKANEALYFTVSDDLPYEGILNNYPDAQIARVARYERLQFASIIQHRNTGRAQHFKIQVDLLGILQDGSALRISTSETPPLVIKGRSAALAKTTAAINPNIGDNTNNFQVNEKTNLNTSIEKSCRNESGPKPLKRQPQNNKPNIEAKRHIKSKEKEKADKSWCEPDAINYLAKSLEDIENKVRYLDYSIPSKVETVINQCNNIFQAYKEASLLKSKPCKSARSESRNSSDTSMFLSEVFNGMPPLPGDVSTTNDATKRISSSEDPLLYADPQLVHQKSF